MASVMDQFGITIETDPNSGAQSITSWGGGTALALTWDADGTASDQLVTSQVQAIQVLNLAAANETPMRLIKRVLDQRIALVPFVP